MPRRAAAGTFFALVALALSFAVVGVFAAYRLGMTHAWEARAAKLGIPIPPAAPPSASPSASVGPAANAADAAPPVPAPTVVHRQTAPLSSAQLGAPLVHGGFVIGCGAPDTMKVAVKVTVKMGHATDVKVTTTPRDARVSECIERATRKLQWDISPTTAHATAHY